MDASPADDVDVDLDELHHLGATLIVEHLSFRREDDHCVRVERHSIVGYPPEYWSVRCLHIGDPTEIMPFDLDDEETADCELCERSLIHSRALHIDRKLARF